MISTECTGCVYVATHIPTGKLYVGKSIRGLEYRQSSHRSWARNTLKDGHCGGRGNRFHNALAKYGDEQFTWEAVFFSDDDQTLLNEEARLIKDYRAAGIELFNISEGGVGPSGWKHTEESKAKIGRAGLGKTPSAETRAKISRTNMGHPVSEKVREAVRQANRDRPRQNYREVWVNRKIKKALEFSRAANKYRKPGTHKLPKSWRPRLPARDETSDSP